MYCVFPEISYRTWEHFNSVFFLPLCACVMQVAPLAADGPHASWLTNKR